MPSYERGAYEPTDEVRVFDAAEEDEDEEGSRLPLLIVMALLVLAAFGSVVWLAYERGVASGRTEPRILTAEQGPAKVAPAAPGGTETPYKGLKIYEQPAPSDEEADAQAAATPSTVSPIAAKPRIAPAATPAAAAAAKPAVTAKPAKPLVTASASPAMTTAAKPVVSPVVVSAPAKPQANSTASVASPTEAETTRPAAPAETKPAVAAAAASAGAAAAGGYVLQIGAYKSQGEADASWKAFDAKHASLLSGFAPNVKQVDLGDKGVWYRLRIGGFADKNAASTLCDRLKSDGGNCFLAT